MTILVADDDRAIRSLLQRGLSRLGWTVLVASDGDQLIELWERERPALVLSDVDLGPGQDGLAACGEILRREPRARVRLMSGDPANDSRAESAGFARPLSKPFTMDELAACLGEAAGWTRGA